MILHPPSSVLRSLIGLVERTENLVRLDGLLTMMGGGGGRRHRTRRGSALVCLDPAIMARSGIVEVAMAWKAMFDVPEIKIVPVGGLLGSAGWFRWR